MFRRIGNLFRILGLVFGLGFLGVAVLGAYSERGADKDLPTRIGESKTTTSFWDDVQAYAGGMWTDFMVEYLPGLVPDPVAYDRKDPNSLDALQTRTRNLANGRAADGGVDITF